MNDILVKVGADITDFSREMKNASNQLSGFADKNAATFDAFKSTGAVITGFGAAVAAGFGKSIKVAANFEAGMSKVAAVSGATGKDLDALTKAARDWGASTSFSASEAASGLEYMALAGWDTQQMLGGIGPILHLAEAGALELGRASDLVTDSMSALGIEVGDLEGYLDKVAKTSASANTDIDALMEAFVIAGGTFSRFNVPLEEANSFLAILANRGFKGSEAGTALNSIMTRLTASTGPSAKALKQLGVNAFDSQGKFRGMETVMKEVESALSGLSDKERAHYQTQIAGLEHGKAFSAMLGGLGQEYDELKGKIVDSDNALIDMRNTMKDNLLGELENLSSAFEEVMTEVGYALLPIIKEAVRFLQDLADKFNGLSEPVKKTIALSIAIAGALALVVGPLLLLIGFIPQIITGFGAVAKVFAALTGPIGLTIAAIIAVGAALVVAYNKVEWFRNMVDKAWAAIKDFTVKAFNNVKDTVTRILKDVVSFGTDILSKFKDFWDENGAQIMAVVKLHFGNIWELIKGVMGVIKGIFEVVWPQIKAIVDIAWRAIKTIVSTAIDIVLGTIQTILKLIQGDWEGAWETIQGVVGSVWDNIKKYFDPDEMKQIGIDVIKGLVNGISSMIDSVGTAVKDIAGNIKGSFKSFFKIKSPSRVMMELGKYIGEGAAIGIAATKSANIAAIKGVSNAIAGVAKASSAEIKALANKQAAEEKAIVAKKHRDIAAIYAQAKAKKRNLTAAEHQRIANITASASEKLVALERKHGAAVAKIQAGNAKERLDAIKRYVDDKKSLEQMSLVAESEVWRRSIALFKSGTKERVEAQQAYQKTLKAINDEITSTNEEFLGKMQRINDDLAANERNLNDEYNSAYSSRVQAILGFSGIFEEFTKSMEKSGVDLLNNLRSQVVGLAEWRATLESLGARIDDQALLEELEALGPKAVGELQALNSLSDSQLAEYVGLYNAKFSLAREQAAKELEGLKSDTEQRIKTMREAANKELEALRGEWTKRIQSVTKATNDELKSLKDIGKNAGKGLMDGLASMEPALVAKAKAIANAVKAAMAGAFNIHSPSRWMRDFIGVNMMRGWIDGMESMRGAVVNTADAATGWMTPERPHVSGYSTPVSGIGISRVGSTQTVGSGGDTIIFENITIDAKTVGEFNSVVEFVSRLRQETRKR
ncbi:phage tail tape measure protein [Sporosarcina sp. ITBMC105]